MSCFIGSNGFFLAYDISVDGSVLIHGFHTTVRLKKKVVSLI